MPGLDPERAFEPALARVSAAVPTAQQLRAVADPFPMQLGGTVRNHHVFAIIAAGGLFLLFGAAILALNYWITWQVEEDAGAINLAGRQRMLSQQMAKALFELNQLPADDESRGDSLRELDESRVLFDATLKGFMNGGPTVDGDGKVVVLDRQTDQEILLVASRASIVWTAFSSAVENVVAHGATNESVEGATYATVHNVELMELMNLLTSRIEHLSRQRVVRLRRLQTVAFTFALLNFLVILRLFHRRVADLSRTYDQLSAIVQNLGTSILGVRRGGTIVLSNTPADQLFGYGHGEMEGLAIEMIVTKREAGLFGLRKDGGTFLVAFSEGEVVINDEPMRLLSVFDVTEQRMSEAAQQHLVDHDPLTGLVNRGHLEQRLRQEVTGARRRGDRAALLFIDLDDFKAINDRHAHRMGDLLLKQVAKRLIRCARDADTVARLGGDEFVVLLSDVPDKDAIIAVADRIRDSLGRTFAVERNQFTIGASIGISQFPQDADDSDALVNMADAAMYRAKAQGGHRYEFYDDEETAAAAPDKVFPLQDIYA